MNERIRKLAEQAGFYFYDMHDVDGQDLGESIEADSFSAADKFAELLIQECAQICKTVGGDHIDNASKEYQEGRKMGTEVCYNMIRKHFGIE